MADQNENPATLEQLEAACLGADATFLLEQLKSKATVESATAAFKDTEKIDALSELKKELWSFRWFFFIVGIVALVMGFGAWLLVKDYGTFGDVFGFPNSVFSALAFAGVIVALILQTKELKEARAERQDSLKIQRESEKRMALAAYLNAVDSIRQIQGGRLRNRPIENHLAQTKILKVLEAVTSANKKVVIDDAGVHIGDMDTEEQFLEWLMKVKSYYELAKNSPIGWLADEYTDFIEEMRFSLYEAEALAPRDFSAEFREMRIWLDNALDVVDDDQRCLDALVKVNQINNKVANSVFKQFVG